MKYKFILLILLFCIIKSTPAQNSQSYFDTDTLYPAHYLGIQYGVVTLPKVLVSVMDFSNNFLSFSPKELTNRRNTGSIFFQYQYVPSRQARFGIVFGIDMERGDVESSSTGIQRKTAEYYDRTTTIALELVALYNRHEKVKLYGKYALGVSQLYQEVNNLNNLRGTQTTTLYYPTFQMSPIGVEIGNTYNGFAELGFGYNGILSMGFRGRF